MLDRIHSFFEQFLDFSTESKDPQHALRLAIAALLLEISHSDGKKDQQEWSAVKRALRSTFDLSAEETAQLMELAEAEQADATDCFRFTSLINDHYSTEQRAKLVEMLWTVAYADNELHKYEEALIRRVADLLYVPHSVFIAAKHRAANARGIA